MAKKRFSPEQVVAKPRQIELLTVGGKSLPQACKEAGITDVTYCRWRKEWDPSSRPSHTYMKSIRRSPPLAAGFGG